MTAIKIDDPLIEKIIRKEGMDRIKKEVIGYIKKRFYSQQQEGEEQKRGENFSEEFLRMTNEVKQNLSKSYTAEEAEKLYREKH